jgi:hypothetical protein
MLIASWIFTSKNSIWKNAKDLSFIADIYGEGEWQYSLEELHNL